MLGRNYHGQAGQDNFDNDNVGDTPDEMPPGDVNYGDGLVTELYGADELSQVLMADGSVRNWGRGLYLGYGSVIDVGYSFGSMPPDTVALGGVVIAVSKGSAGAGHSCVMLQDMTMRCWGRNTSGQLGNGGMVLIGDDPGEMPPAPVQAF